MYFIMKNILNFVLNYPNSNGIVDMGQRNE